MTKLEESEKCVTVLDRVTHAHQQWNRLNWVSCGKLWNVKQIAVTAQFHHTQEAALSCARMWAQNAHLFDSQEALQPYPNR